MTLRRAEFDAPVLAARAQASRRALLALLLAGPLAACGRRGRLELPPDARGQRAAPPPLDEEYEAE